jgi:hypothetical protein
MWRHAAICLARHAVAGLGAWGVSQGDLVEASVAVQQWCLDEVMDGRTRSLINSMLMANIFTLRVTYNVQLV